MPRTLPQLLQPTLVTLTVVLLFSCGGDSSKKESETKTKSFEDTYSVLPIIAKDNMPHFELKEGESPPQTEKEYIKVVDRAISAGAYEEAITYSKKGLALHPKSGKLHYLLAKSLMSTVGKNEQEAVNHLEKATKLGYEKSKLYALLASIYSDQKEYDKAIKVLTRAIKLNPGNRTLYKYRAAMYVTLGNFDKAEADYTTLIKVSGKKKAAASYKSRAQFYESQKQLEKALNDYTTAYKTGMERLSVLKKRMPIYTKLGKTNEAIQDLNEIVKLNPDDDDAFTTRGNLFAKRKEYKQALADYTKAIKLAPDYAYKAYEGRSIVYEKLSKPELAKSDRQKAKKLYSRPAEKTLFKMKDKKQ